jgi:hypothetical protein
LVFEVWQLPAVYQEVALGLFYLASYEDLEIIYLDVPGLVPARLVFFELSSCVGI